MAKGSPSTQCTESSIDLVMPSQLVSSTSPLGGLGSPNSAHSPTQMEIETDFGRTPSPFRPDFLKLTVFSRGSTALCLNLGMPSAGLQAHFVSILALFWGWNRGGKGKKGKKRPLLSLCSETLWWIAPSADECLSSLGSYRCWSVVWCTGRGGVLAFPGGGSGLVSLGFRPVVVRLGRLCWSLVVVLVLLGIRTRDGVRCRGWTCYLARVYPHFFYRLSIYFHRTP